MQSFLKCIVTPEELERLRSEAISRKSISVSTVAALLDVFEDHEAFYTVVEYCCGKDLLSTLMETPIYSEQEAAEAIFQILTVPRFSV